MNSSCLNDPLRQLSVAPRFKYRGANDCGASQMMTISFSRAANSLRRPVMLTATAAATAVELAGVGADSAEAATWEAMTKWVDLQADSSRLTGGANHVVW